MYNRSRYLLLVLATAALAACSDGPSEGDIQALLEAEVTQANDMVNELAGAEMAAAMQTEIHDITLHGCDKVQDDTYRCDIEVDITAPMVGHKVQRSTITLTDTDAGWTATP